MTAKATIEFTESDDPITQPVSKFGGQPVWIDDPQWPLSKETGNQMRFICQIALDETLFPGSAGKVAYLFMTEEEDGSFVDSTYEPDGGENAIIIQPGKSSSACCDQAEGPTLYRMVEKEGFDLLQQVPCEFSINPIPGIDTEVSDDGLDENKVGGLPVFMQGEEYPSGGPWRLLLQLDSCNVPFYVNFGDAGVGYAFVNESGSEAKFLWQCG